MLFHPSFIKLRWRTVAVHDNRMDKASWNEQWMGYPVGPQVRRVFQCDNAGKLRGNHF